MDQLMHAEAPTGSVYHLASPTGQSLTEVYDGFARAAEAPCVLLTTPAWTGAPLRRLGDLAAGVVDRVTGGPAVREAVFTELGIPVDVLSHLSMSCEFDSTDTRVALAGTGIHVPDFADVLWQYWIEHLDPDRAKPTDRHQPLADRRILITGASSGTGRATAREVAGRGAIPLLVARRPDQLDAVRAEIQAAGGTAHAYPYDLTDADAVDALVKQVLADHKAVDMLVNNAGRSIRRSVHLSVDRMHDFERTMSLNYFAPLRLTLGLLPHMRAKAALDEFSTVAGRNCSVTT